MRLNYLFQVTIIISLKIEMTYNLVWELIQDYKNQEKIYISDNIINWRLIFSTLSSVLVLNTGCGCNTLLGCPLK